VHPHSASQYNQNLENKIKEMAGQKKIVAVGEIGLDFYYNYSPPSEQKNAFQKQLALAQDLKLPVIIHSRQAASNVFSLIKEQNFTNGGIMHCFTENLDFAKKMLDRGFYISFSGIITYPKAHDLRETAKKIPADRLLIETDAPFLTPVPLRNRFKRNEPVFILETAKVLADLKKMPFESFAEKMCQNFSSLFNLNYDRVRL
jgi:TatD DNase family protein